LTAQILKSFYYIYFLDQYPEIIVSIFHFIFIKKKINTFKQIFDNIISLLINFFIHIINLKNSIWATMSIKFIFGPNICLDEWNTYKKHWQKEQDTKHNTYQWVVTRGLFFFFIITKKHISHHKRFEFFRPLGPVANKVTVIGQSKSRCVFVNTT
jgi:hypothetical protein